MQTLVEGQSIRHEQYGMGIVTESNHERTTIDFDDHGVKRFVTSIWSAELIGEPPATPPQIREKSSVSKLRKRRDIRKSRNAFHKLKVPRAGFLRLFFFCKPSVCSCRISQGYPLISVRKLNGR